jgi:hypothetical protein
MANIAKASKAAKTAPVKKSVQPVESVEAAKATKAAAAKKELKKASGNRIATKQRLASTVGVENATTCNVLRLVSVKTAMNGNVDGLRVRFTEGFRFNPKGLSRKSATVWISNESLKDVYVTDSYCVSMDARGSQEVDFGRLGQIEEIPSLDEVIEELDLKDTEVKVKLYFYFANIYTKVLDENPFEQKDLPAYDIVHEYDGEPILEGKFIVNNITGLEEGTTEVMFDEGAVAVEVVAAE